MPGYFHIAVLYSKQVSSLVSCGWVFAGTNFVSSLGLLGSKSNSGPIHWPSPRLLASISGVFWLRNLRWARKFLFTNHTLFPGLPAWVRVGKYQPSSTFGPHVARVIRHYCRGALAHSSVGVLVAVQLVLYINIV